MSDLLQFSSFCGIVVENYITNEEGAAVRRIYEKNLPLFFRLMRLILDELQMRLLVGAMSLFLGWGSIQRVAEAAEVSASTVSRGRSDVRKYQDAIEQGDTNAYGFIVSDRHRKKVLIEGTCETALSHETDECQVPSESEDSEENKEDTVENQTQSGTTPEQETEEQQMKPVDTDKPQQPERINESGFQDERSDFSSDAENNIHDVDALESIGPESILPDSDSNAAQNAENSVSGNVADSGVDSPDSKDTTPDSENINKDNKSLLRRKPRKRGRPKKYTTNYSKRRVRRNPSGKVGRPNMTTIYPALQIIIQDIIDGFIVGDPETDKLWISLSLHKIKKELGKHNIYMSESAIRKYLNSLGYSLQQNKKMMSIGKDSPLRNEQFLNIKNAKQLARENGIILISIDCKKKENIGNFANKGREYRPIGEPRPVSDHDFKNDDMGPAIPYGIYDIILNKGFINLGISKDTAQFSVNSLREYLTTVGKEDYPNAKEVVILCDCGGSNGYRSRLWKMELCKLAEELQINITVMHYPPGTSKWNPIEHRLFSEISKNWRAQPLTSIEKVMRLISSTTTQTGLTVKCVLDEGVYEKGIKVSDAEMRNLHEKYIVKHEFCPDWNYTIYGCGKPEPAEAA